MSQGHLEGYNFFLGSDEHHGQRATKEIPAEEFFGKAVPLLEQLRDPVVHEIVPQLETMAGRWNPGGFMVFPLGIHEELGSLRLHVWPEGVERRTAQGPNVHDHAWHLASHIVTGEYSDVLFDLDVVDDEDALMDPDSDVYRLFETRRNPGGKDTLVTDGTCVRPRPIVERKLQAGESHTIDVGVCHLSTIPKELLTVTLVLDSPAFAPTTRVLLKNPAPEVARQRRTVDPMDAFLAKQQIMQQLGIS